MQQRWTTVAWVLSMAFVLTGGPAGGEGRKIKVVTKDVCLGRMPSGTIPGSITFSQDMQRVAFVVREGNREYVVVDGVKGNEYDAVGRGWGPDGTNKDGPRFSADGKRVTYVAKRGAKWLVVADGREGPEYEVVGSPVFSRDRNLVAYVAKRASKEFVVVNGVEGKPYDGIGWIGGRISDAKPVISPDSQRVAYVARRAGRNLVVVDGVEGKEYAMVSDLHFSSDDKHVLWRAQRPDNKWVRVVDGVEADDGKGERLAREPFPSPDGKRKAQVVQRGEKHVLVVDGVEGLEFDTVIAIPRAVFSPDSQRVAYVGGRCLAAPFGGAGRGRPDRFVVVVDGKPGKEYDEIPGYGALFSPDSKRVAHIAQRGGRRQPGSPFVELGAKFLMVLDGQEGKEYDEVWGPVFSPDSQHVAYVARRVASWLVVRDGIEGKEYERVTDLMFSPDSRHVAYKATRGPESFVVVDGAESNAYDVAPPSARLVLDSPNMLRTIALRNREFFRVEVEIVED